MSSKEALTTEQRRALMFKHQVMVERSVYTMDFYDLYFKGCTIHQIFIRHGWVCMLSRTSLSNVLLVQEFYATLTVIDLHVDKWEVTI